MAEARGGRQPFTIHSHGDADAIRHWLEYASYSGDREVVCPFESRHVERRGAHDELVLLPAHGCRARIYAIQERDSVEVDLDAHAARRGEMLRVRDQAVGNVDRRSCAAARERFAHPVARITGCANRSRDPVAGTPPRCHAASASPGPPSRPVTYTVSPSRAASRRSGAATLPSTVTASVRSLAPVMSPPRIVVRAASSASPM